MTPRRARQGVGMEGGPTRSRGGYGGLREKLPRGEERRKDGEGEPVPPIYIPANPPHQRRSSFLLK